jgi:hypothetical protein
MNTRRLLPLAIVLLCALVLASNALAGMSSANYRLDWYVLLTGGGGGPTDSTNYAANFTVGQTAIGAADSTNYEAGLGYWYGAAGGYEIYLPLILRDYS